jgi:prophage antirepressor-like protein
MSIEDMADSAADPRNLPVEFTFDESLVRTVIKDGQAWFVAKDMCEILDINDPSMAVSRLDDDERGTASLVRQRVRVNCSR